MIPTNLIPQCTYGKNSISPLRPYKLKDALSIQKFKGKPEANRDWDTLTFSQKLRHNWSKSGRTFSTLATMALIPLTFIAGGPIGMMLGSLSAALCIFCASAPIVLAIKNQKWECR